MKIPTWTEPKVRLLARVEWRGTIYSHGYRVLTVVLIRTFRPDTDPREAYSAGLNAVSEFGLN